MCSRRLGNANHAWQSLACTVMWWSGPIRRAALRWDHVEAWDASSRRDRSILVGAATSARNDLRLNVDGDTDVSDALTKPLGERRMTKLLASIGFEYREGRTSLDQKRWRKRRVLQRLMPRRPRATRCLNQ